MATEKSGGPLSRSENRYEPREPAGPMPRCVIVTSGPFGPYNPVKPLLRPDDFIVCADGGLVHARNLGLTPSVAVGDFDSTRQPPAGEMEIFRYQKEKDETDTILAIDYGLRQGFRDFLILGGLRGRLDHTVANFSALMHLYRRNGIHCGCFERSPPAPFRRDAPAAAEGLLRFGFPV